MKRKMVLIAIFVWMLDCIPLHIFAQNANDFFIEVAQKDGKVIPDILVQLINIKDSNQVYTTFSNDSGVASFRLVPASYKLIINTTGYADFQSDILVTDTSKFFKVSIQPQASTLSEVVIAAERPLIRQEDDKTIIDPTYLADASTNGYEILEKTPGLFVDQDGNIYLNSTTPASVFLNGRELKMSRTDIAAMLRSLPPNSIEKIEILRTPSAKYDATASGGIVNVVLKKGVKLGLNGSVNAGFQQGKYGSQHAGFSMNHNNGRTGTYFNLNFSNNNNYDSLNTTRVVKGDTMLLQAATTLLPEQNAYLGYGINHDFNEKWSMSYDGRFSTNFSKAVTDNSNTFKILEDTLGTAFTRLDNKGTNWVLSQELASKYRIDTAGSEWLNSLNYTWSNNLTQQQYNTETQYQTAFGGDGTTKNNRNYIAFQTDLVYKFPYRITFETGLKLSYLSFSNEANYFLNINNSIDVDSSRTVSYQYTENINSAYIQASKGLGAFLLKAGLRMENTNMLGKQTTPGYSKFSIHLADFFPYVYLSRKVMSIAKYELRAYLVYRRTMMRPSYDQLNPFAKYVDQFLSEMGNPSLKPQFTNNYEANISIMDRPLFAVGYNNTQDLFTNVYYQNEVNPALAYRTYDNIGHNREFYLRGFAAIPPGGVYFFVLGGQFNRNWYEGQYDGKPLSFVGDSWMFFTYHQLKIGKKSMLTANGFLRLKGPLQFYELGTFGALNLSINRHFFDKKLTITLSTSDVFFTKNNDFKIQQPNVNASGYRESDSRRVGLSLRYNFGIVKKEEPKNMFENTGMPTGQEQNNIIK